MKKILVIDDDLGILEVLKIMLTGENYLVETISKSDNDVVKMLEGKEPDLILIDMLLSGFDGRDITKKLKSDKGTKDIPIIMLSAHPNARTAAIKAGANDFVAKPFDMYALLDAVKKQLN